MNKELKSDVFDINVKVPLNIRVVFEHSMTSEQAIKAFLSGAYEDIMDVDPHFETVTMDDIINIS